MSYEIQWSRRANKSLRSLLDGDCKLVLDKVGLLSDEPRPTSSSNIEALPGAYRIRAGNWRIAYYVSDEAKAVFIHDVQRRNETTYRRFRS